MNLLERLLAYAALFFTIALLEAIAIERVIAGPLADRHWRTMKHGRGKP